MNNRFVFRAPKCINPENFIKIRALLESLVYQYPRFLHLRRISSSVADESSACEGSIKISKYYRRYIFCARRNIFCARRKSHPKED
jgi:hypothetical protein